MLDGTPALDPFAGNYTLVPLQDIVVAYLGINEAVTLQAFPVTATMVGQGPPTLAGISQGATETFTSSAAETSRISLASADFDGDGRDEAALIYFNGTDLKLTIQRYDEVEACFESVLANPITLLSPSAQGAVRLAAGWFEELADPATTTQPIARLAHAVADGDALAVAIWDLSTSTPSLLASDSSIKLAGSFDIASGDLDGDGIEELVVVYQGPAGDQQENLFVSAYKLVQANGAYSLSLLGTTGIGTANAGAVSVRCGNILPNSPTTGQTLVVDQIVVGWSQANANSGTVGAPTLAAISFQQANGTFSIGTAWSDSSAYPLTSNGILRVAVGDLNLDGVDEIILGTEGCYPTYSSESSQPDVLVLRCFQATGILTLNLTSTGIAGSETGYSLVYSDLSLEIGAPSPAGSEDALLSSLVVGCVGFDTVEHVLQGIGMVTVGVIQMSGDLVFPSALTTGLASFVSNNSDGLPAVNVDSAQGLNLAIDLALALGDFAGRSIRVGTPTYFQADAVNGVLAIINALPSDPNAVNPESANVSFQQTNSQQSQLALSVNNDWSASDTLGATMSIPSLASLNASITNTYGVGFSQSTIAISGLMILLSDSVYNDDGLYLSQTDYDVWEYPVFNNATGAPAGHILVVFPDVPGQPQLNWTNTSDKSSYYAPRHNANYLLSYPQYPDFPTDFMNQNALYSGQASTVTPGSSLSLMIQYSQMNIDTVGSSSRVGLNVSRGASTSQTLNPDFLPGATLGLSINTTDSYNASALSSHAITYMNQSAIQIMFGRCVDVSKQYQVIPLVYWSTYGEPISYPIVTITGTPTGGTFTITVNIGSSGPLTTSAIAFNADATAVETALEALSSVGAGNVVVQGAAGGPYSLVFQGALATTVIPCPQANGSGLTGGLNPSATVTMYQSSAGNNMQVVSVTGDPTGGTFILGFSLAGQTPQNTIGIAYNATALAVQNALGALTNLGSGNVTVTGTSGGPYYVSFIGTLANTQVPAMAADGTDLTGGTSPSASVSITTLGKYMVVDFITTLLPGTYWTDDTLTPVPTFNFPWAGSADPTWQYLSRSIELIQLQDGSVQLIATVSNYSMGTGQGYNAQFYVGAPASGTPIGSLQSVPELPPAGSSVVAVTWTPPSTSAACPIFCEITENGSTVSQAFNMYPPNYFNAFSQPSNVVQVVTVTSGAKTSFTLSLLLNGNTPQVTTEMSLKAAASDVQVGLAALSNVGRGNVAVTGSSGGPWTVTFLNNLASSSVIIPLLVPSSSVTVI